MFDFWRADRLFASSDLNMRIPFRPGEAKRVPARKAFKG
jgi:hypothetical protein